MPRKETTNKKASKKESKKATKKSSRKKSKAPPIPYENLKPKCTITDLKRTERRGTMVECAERKKIYYYGLHKADPIVARVAPKLKEKKMSLIKVQAKMQGLKARANRLKREMDEAKTTKEKEEKKKEANDAIVEFNDLRRIYIVMKEEADNKIIKKK